MQVLAGGSSRDGSRGDLKRSNATRSATALDDAFCRYAMPAIKRLRAEKCSRRSKPVRFASAGVGKRHAHPKPDGVVRGTFARAHRSAKDHFRSRRSRRRFLHHEA